MCMLDDCLKMKSVGKSSVFRPWTANNDAGKELSQDCQVRIKTEPIDNEGKVQSSSILQVYGIIKKSKLFLVK